MSGARIGRVRMKNGGADVRVLHQPPPEPASDIIRQLRTMADNLERGEHEPVDTVTVVVESARGEIAVFLWGDVGRGDSLPRTVGMLHLGIEHLTRMRLRGFEDEE